MRDLMKKNATEAFRILLNRLKARFSDKTIKKLMAHPNYPSLLSLSHILTELGIEHAALRSSYEQMQHELPKPLLVHLHANGGMYLVVEKLDEQAVHFINEKHQLEAQPKDDFLQSWSGHALIFDEEAIPVEKDYRINKVREWLDRQKWPFLIFLSAMLLFFVLYYQQLYYGLFDYLFLITKALGVSITVPLMIQYFDKENLLVKKLCQASPDHKKQDCNTILDSKAAYLLGLVSWSEIGFLYFSSLFLYLLLFPQSHTLALVAICALAALPYTLYSIHYQWRVARSWCRLCLMTQAVILGEAVLAVNYFVQQGRFDPLFSGRSLAAFLLAAGLTTALYAVLKPVLNGWQQYRQQFPVLNRIKLQPEVLQLLQRNHRPIHTQDLTPLRLGPADTRHRILIISSPVCRPCINMHPLLFDIRKNKPNTSIEEVFLTHPEPEDISFQLGSTILQLYHQLPEEEFAEILQTYYEHYINRPEDWITKYANLIPHWDETHAYLHQHQQWCVQQGIFGTPVVFYNGRALPQGYKLSDLYYLID
jgi:uncharacterized membrane protein